MRPMGGLAALASTVYLHNVKKGQIKIIELEKKFNHVITEMEEVSVVPLSTSGAIQYKRLVNHCIIKLQHVITKGSNSVQKTSKPHKVIVVNHLHYNTATCDNKVKQFSTKDW